MGCLYFSVVILAFVATDLEILTARAGFAASLLAIIYVVSLDHAGVDRKTLTLSQAFGHAASNNRIEQLAKCVVVTETAVSIPEKA